MELLTRTLPLFALPGNVLLPRSRVQIYMHSPGHRALAQECRCDCGRLAIGLIKPSRSCAGAEMSPMHSMMCIASVLEHTCHADGSFTLWIEGRERARLIEELSPAPYRAGRIKIEPDRYDTLDPDALQSETLELRSVALGVAHCLPAQARTIRLILHSYSHPSMMADLLAFHLVPEPYDRQCVLETLDVGRRIRMVIIQLRTLLRQLHSLRAF